MHATLYSFVMSTTELDLSFVWQLLVLCKGQRGSSCMARILEGSFEQDRHRTKTWPLG